MSRRSVRRLAQKAGKRSGWEVLIAEDLDAHGVSYEYEREKFVLHLPKTGAKCDDCGSKLVSSASKYTPDWFLESGIVVESKGRFTARDRKIAIAMRDQYPGTDHRMLFRTDNKLSKKSTTRYSAWCDKHGIKYAVGPTIPEEWYGRTRDKPSKAGGARTSSRRARKNSKTD